MGTVALVAGIGLASAQGPREAGGGSERMSSGSSQIAPEFRESAGPKSEGAKSGAAKSQSKSESRGEGAAARESSREHQLNHGQAQREEPTKGSRASKRSTGQAKSEQHERSTTGQGSTEKTESAKGAMSREEKAKAAEGKKEGAASGQSSAQKKNENATTGQAPSTGAAADKNGDKNQSSESTKAQSPQGQSSRDTGCRPAESGNRRFDARQHRSIAGRRDRNGATADDDPTERTVGPKRATRRSRELRH